MQCALLWNTSFKYTAAPHNVHAHSLLCRTVEEIKEEDEADRAAPSDWESTEVEMDRTNNGTPLRAEDHTKDSEKSNQEPTDRAADTGV